MEIDANDILYTNKFVKLPETKEVPSEFNEEFRKYYKEEIEKTKRESIKEKSESLSIKDLYLDEDADGNNLMNTNKFNNNADTTKTEEIRRYKREVKTYINIDSRDRDKVIYTKPNEFKVYLGKTFNNVKNIKLASIEFPNTNAVINSSNNKIYWINQEDITDDRIDNLTGTYPVYEVSLRIGSYVINTLQSEISSQLASVRRQNGDGNPHNFVVTMDNDTDIVKFLSLDLIQLDNNPISTQYSQTTVKLNVKDLNYLPGEKIEIYLTGTKTVAGIPTSALNGLHTAIVITTGSAGVLQFETNVIASESAIGGGNTIKMGTKTPFQLLFGEYNTTIAPNIGFPLENSSQRIVNNIKLIENYILVEVTTTLDTPISFYDTFNFIGQTCQFINTGESSLDGTREIVKIINSNTFLVQVNNKLSSTIILTGTVDIAGSTLDISQAKNNKLETILVETFTPHYYTNSDIDHIVTLYNTTTTPNLDGDSTIYSVLSETKLIFPGYVLQNVSINNSEIGNAGYIAQHNPLKTFSHNITNVIPGIITTITTDVKHKFKVGDSVEFINLVTIPPLSTQNPIYTVNSIPNEFNFTIDIETTSFDNTNIINGSAKIGSPVIEFTFPFHGYNKIMRIENVLSSNTMVEIETKYPHNISIPTGKLSVRIRISNSNSIPSVDESYELEVDDIISDYIFRIPFAGSITNGDYGILGLSQTFILYGSEEIDGIKRDEINGIKYTVRDIIDQDKINFACNGIATSGLSGGGSNLYINSFLHGFNGQQDNTKNNLLNRSINLEGENYAFLCCPQLATMLNTGNVKNIFARILLDESPGHMVFSFLSNPKTFDTVPLDKLDELEFSIVNYNNTLYEFNDLDYSFVLEITEVIDTTDSFNISSKRGIVDTS